MVSHTAVKMVGTTLAAIALTGCGRAASPTSAYAPGAPLAKQVVGLPANYQAGEMLPGGPGTPSLRAVNWPRIAKTASGELSDPVNLIIAGDERHVRHVFGQAGWVEAQPVNFLTGLKTVKTAILGGEYKDSPMSDLYAYNRKQDIALQKNAQGTRARDHLRLWQAPLKDRLGRPIWLVAATQDVAIKLGPGMKAPTHQIAPFIDDERQLVVNDFMKSGHVAMRYQLQSLEPNFRGVNGGGDYFTTDGKVEVLELVPMKASTAR